MVLKFQYGIVTTAKHQIFQNQESIIVHGKKNLHLKNAVNGINEFTGEERTFDTWMDSSITPLFITKYGKDHKLHNYGYPTQMRPQGKDIVRTWLYYTMLRCFQLTGEQPWSEIWIMGYGIDEKGEKMSKSKGNVIDPFPVIKQYGADTFRFWSASEGNLGYDFRCSEQRIASAQKFLSKLWNVARFISSFDVILDTPSHIAHRIDGSLQNCQD